MQDNWRVSRNFTIDRASALHIANVSETDRDIGRFDPNAWEPARAVQLWRRTAPTLFPFTSANRVAWQSAEPRAAALPWIVAVVAGSGDFTNGTVYGKACAQKQPRRGGSKTAPRLGLAWDVFGERQDGGPRRVWHQLQPAR